VTGRYASLMKVGDAAAMLALAALLGALIGFQRQWAQKPAGLRTHALVSLGACAFAAYSTLLHDTRIAAGVITGIGFLGAGAIVRHGFTTRGLTTAASIWTACAIGLGVGLGGRAWLPIAFALTFLTMLLLTISDEAIVNRLPRRNSIVIDVEIDVGIISIERVTAELGRLVNQVKFNDDLAIDVEGDRRKATIGYTIRTDVHANLVRIFEALSAIDGVLRVAVSEESAFPG
jgi:putative Mg2+ transporter-C (MgtC) family protein